MTLDIPSRPILEPPEHGKLAEHFKRHPPGNRLQHRGVRAGRPRVIVVQLRLAEDPDAEIRSLALYDLVNDITADTRISERC